MKTMERIRSSEITPEHVYLSRRRLLRFGLLGAAGLALTACGGQVGEVLTGASREAGGSSEMFSPDKRDELGDPANSFRVISNYNNYYEFTLDKEAVARLAANFKAEPWKVTVDGLVRNPRTYDLDDLRRKFDQEERIYRLRCVEGWSMVIPWLGFPLAKLLREVEPHRRRATCASSRSMTLISIPTSAG